MKASEWKKRGARCGAVELELPSGMVILARRPNPLQMATWGRLPLGLAAAASGEDAGAPSDSDVMATAEYLRELLVYCCVEPRVSLEPKGEDEIHPRDIPREDWQYLVAWAMRAEEARALTGFRGERAGDRAGGDGADVGLPAERAAGDR